MDLFGDRRLAEVLGARLTAQRRKGAAVQGVRRGLGKKRIPHPHSQEARLGSG
jgi:hypothetical protein